MTDERRAVVSRSVDSFLRSGLTEARAGSWVPVESLYERLVEGCTMERLPLPGIAEMLEILEERGYPTETIGRGRVVMGLALRNR